jgi:hypothetical protein
VRTDWERQPGTALLFGQADQQLELMRTADDWYEADHAYFGRHRYFRVTHRATYTRGDGAPDFARLDALNLPIVDRKPRIGKHILITLQSGQYYSRWLGVTENQFLDQVMQDLARVTKRHVVFRRKPIGKMRYQPHISTLLKDATCVVTHSSGTALDALQWGVPVCVLDDNYPAARLGTKLEDIDQAKCPSIDERRDLFARLAAQQWTETEMASGQAWAALNGHG